MLKEDGPRGGINQFVFTLKWIILKERAVPRNVKHNKT